MSEKLKLFIRDSAITILTLTVFFFISLIIHTAFDSPSLIIPPLFVLAVFLISLFTNGYKYGIVAALISVLAVNFAFTFPFFSFNFTIIENLFSAVIILVVTTLTSTLTTKIKRQEEVKLQVNMANIRRKLSLKPGENQYISNELGVGYRMHNDNE